MDVFSIAAGGFGVVGAYFIYLAARHGLPAALAWAKARWSAGKADLASLQGDVENAHSMLNLHDDAIQALQKGLAAIAADVARLKGQAPAPAAPGFLGATAAANQPAPAAGGPA